MKPSSTKTNTTKTKTKTHKKILHIFQLYMIRFVLFCALLLALAIIIPIMIIICTKNRKDVQLVEGQREYEGSSGKVEVKPEALNSLQKFLKSFKDGNEDGLLYVVRLYCYGLPPEYAPSKILGMRLINRVAIDNRFSEKLKMSCRVIFEDSSIMAYDDIDARNDEYKELPDNIIDIIESIIDYQLKHNVALNDCTTNVTHTVIENYVDEDINALLPNDIPNETTIIVHNDSQNVHNHSVGNSCVKILDQLSEKNTKLDSYEDNVFTFLKEADSMVKDKNVFQQIVDILDTFSAHQHSKYLRSEQDVFVSVFSRIMAYDEEKKQDMLQIFIDNILSSIEHGVVVCSTGKITRMLSTFDAVDDEFTDIKPDWVLKEEIANVAIKIRDNIIKNLTEKELEAYNDGEREDISQDMKAQLITECTSTYVNTNILSKSALDVLLDDYLNAF